MLITCPKCGKKFSDTSDTCIHCGERLIKYKKCPECQSFCFKDAPQCYNCGYDFNKAAAKAEAERNSRKCRYCYWYESLGTCSYYYNGNHTMDAKTCPNYRFSQVAYDNRLTNGCYLTTACVEYYGKPDDCYELQTLRKFRDEILKKTPEGQALCEEYYRIAPPIVERLHKLNDKANYEYIYSKILKCIKYIENQENEEAISVYKDMCIKMQKL